MRKAETSYDILRVAPNASQTDIHAAYRRLAMAAHPDRHPESRRAEASRNFQRLQEAYDKIKTEQNRVAYNQWLKTRTHAIMVNHSAVTNDNRKTSRTTFLDVLETIFWPVERRPKDGD